MARTEIFLMAELIPLFLLFDLSHLADFVVFLRNGVTHGKRNNLGA
jgi:hypothetical protein